MGDPSIIILKIIETLILFLILSLPPIGLIVYSYILSKLILSLTKHHFNLNMSFSRIWEISFYSGFSGIISIFITLFSYSSVSVNHILESAAITIFITSLIAHNFLSNVSLRSSIVMSFVTTLAYLPFIIIVYNVINILLYLISLRACCTCYIR